MTKVLNIEDVVVRPRRRYLLDGITLSVDAGESVAIVGPSGSGKTTLLSVCLGLFHPHAGTVEVCGADLATMRPARLARHRSSTTGTIFQFGELLPELTPAENVALPSMWQRRSGSADSLARAMGLLHELRVDTEVERSIDLSGGERQRTAVARALINEPRLILADEPTGALDEENATRVAELIFSLTQNRDCGLLLVTHDRSLADRADRVLRLDEGQLTPEPSGRG